MYLTSLCILLTASIYAWKGSDLSVIKFEQIQYSSTH